MAPIVLAGKPNRRATGRAAALSHASPIASSNRLLKGALLGNCGTFLTLVPQSATHSIDFDRHRGPELHAGQIPHLPLRTSCASSSLRPHPEQISFRWPRFCRIHNFNVFAFSLISCRSLCRKPPSLPKPSQPSNPRLLAPGQIPAQSHKMPRPPTSRRDALLPVAQYVRMSTDQQQYSIDNQREGISRYAGLN
jgi:hypothetical protein